MCISMKKTSLRNLVYTKKRITYDININSVTRTHNHHSLSLVISNVIFRLSCDSVRVRRDASFIWNVSVGGIKCFSFC